jgi:hypothetical protein
MVVSVVPQSASITIKQPPWPNIPRGPTTFVELDSFGSPRRVERRMVFDTQTELAAEAHCDITGLATDNPAGFTLR